MARFEGKLIKGLIGRIVIKNGKNGAVVQSRPKRKRRTEEEIKSSGVFGKSSSLGKIIRNQQQVIFSGYDGGMVNRMTRELHEVLKHAFHKENDTYHFQPGSFERLEGFNFNLQSPLANTLWVKPYGQIAGNVLRLILPETEPGTQLVFPEGTTHCMITLALTMVALHAGWERTKMVRLKVERSAGLLPAQEWTFPVPEGCLCVAGMGLAFWYEGEGYKSGYQRPGFSPAMIFSAKYRPGQFPPPVPGQWQPTRLKFPVT